MANTDDLALLLINVELEQGKIINSLRYPFIDFQQAKRIAAMDSELELIWWTERQEPFIAWRIVRK